MGSQSVLEFMMAIGKLKQLRRTGWVKRQVHDPESVADHMYRMAIMAFFVDNKQGIDRDRCIKLALIHDMAECVVGDLTPTCGVSKDEKHKQEKAAMQEVCLLAGPIGVDLYQLWEEYENQTTLEAKAVKDFDRFDMILQAYEYEKQEQRPGDLQEFFDSTEGKFSTEDVRQWVSDLKKLRTTQ